MRHKVRVGNLIPKLHKTRSAQTIHYLIGLKEATLNEKASDYSEDDRLGRTIIVDA
jgi:hypothetical protein